MPAERRAVNYRLIAGIALIAILALGLLAIVADDIGIGPTLVLIGMCAVIAALSLGGVYLIGTGLGY